MSEFKRQTLDVHMLATDETTVVHHRVQLILGDQLRAELELNKRGIDITSLGAHRSAAIAWSAMVRAGLYDKKFDQFGEDVVDIASVDEDEQEVDPTRPAASDDSA